MKNEFEKSFFDFDDDDDNEDDNDNKNDRKMKVIEKNVSNNMNEKKTMIL